MSFPHCAVSFPQNGRQERPHSTDLLHPLLVARDSVRFSPHVLFYSMEERVTNILAKFQVTASTGSSTLTRFLPPSPARSLPFLQRFKCRLRKPLNRLTMLHANRTVSFPRNRRRERPRSANLPHPLLVARDSVRFFPPVLFYSMEECIINVLAKFQVAASTGSSILTRSLSPLPARSLPF